MWLGGVGVVGWAGGGWGSMGLGGVGVVGWAGEWVGNGWGSEGGGVHFEQYPKCLIKLT